MCFFLNNALDTSHVLELTSLTNLWTHTNAQHEVTKVFYAFSPCVRAKGQGFGPLLAPSMAGTGEGVAWLMAFLNGRPVVVSRRGLQTNSGCTPSNSSFWFGGGSAFPQFTHTASAQRAGWMGGFTGGVCFESLGNFYFKSRWWCSSPLRLSSWQSSLCFSHPYCLMWSEEDIRQSLLFCCFI